MRVITTSSSPRPPASLIDWPMSSKQPCTCSAAVSPCATVPAIHTLWVMLQGEHSSARQSSRPRCESCPLLAQLETSSSDLPKEQHRNRRSSGRTCSAAPRLWRPDGGCALPVASACAVFWGALRSFRTTECGGLTLRPLKNLSPTSDPSRRVPIPPLGCLFSFFLSFFRRVPRNSRVPALSPVREFFFWHVTGQELSASPSSQPRRRAGAVA